MPNYKKRSTYQTGGTARTQYSTSDIAKYTRDKTNRYSDFMPVVRVVGSLISPSQNTQTTQAV